MSASEQLGKYGLSVDVAREWIVAHLNAPKAIYDVALAGGLSNDMIAEILAPLAPGLNGTAVESFFTRHGFAGSALNDDSPANDSGKATLLSDDMASLTGFVGMNAHEGALSTESLRQATQAQLNNANLYNELFSPDNYIGAEDGLFTAAEIGVPGLATFAATSANLESLYYGTLINVLKSVDTNEVHQLYDFITANQAALEAGSETAAEQLSCLMLSAFEDPADAPAFSDDLIAAAIRQGTAVAVQIVGGSDDSSLFGNAFDHLLG